MAPKASAGIETCPEPVFELIDRQSVLTLATAGERGPWCAPVYYVCVGTVFYFFSSPQSRHVLDALQAGQAAGSIFVATDAWQTIRGIQMSGTVGQVRAPALSLRVIAAYLKRFPFTRSFFQENTAPDLEAFFRTFRARLFAFTPTAVYYVDNRSGMGGRRRIGW